MVLYYYICNYIYIVQYYYEPGSGRKFRSCIGAKRYIAELKEDIPLSAALAEIKEMNRPLSKAFKLGRLVKVSASFISSRSGFKFSISVILLEVADHCFLSRLKKWAYKCPNVNLID